ncbi:MAG: hypothetical protein JSW64_00475 [Candidatus Zixiibacteriota bacterium]|nr:MAG: hypothetical protein JSW64_00475 [candidate division Zixibacteria bacterium]
MKDEFTEVVDPEAFEIAIGKISDGFIFEKFALPFMGQVLGDSFIPVAGLKDKGIDAFKNIYARKSNNKFIYQLSIEKWARSKIEKSIEKLVNNNIDFDMFIYATNKKVKDIEVITEQLLTVYQKAIRIYDLRWFANNINFSEGTIKVYYSYVSKYLNEYNLPGRAISIDDHVSDPRLFVFLSQQWDYNKGNYDLLTNLVDTLILYVLEGTDPDKKLFKSIDEIKIEISNLIKSDIAKFSTKINERLGVLSKKSRKIQFHKKVKGYCLPYQTRLSIQQRNIMDLNAYDNFIESLDKTLKLHLRKEKIRVGDCKKLIMDTFHSLFYQQGLEFSNFILRGVNRDTFEGNIVEIIDRTIDKSPVVEKNKEKVKYVLIDTIRQIVYKGSETQKHYLKRLSNTYMLLFLVQCEPKIVSYFNILASKLKVYVGTSVIIPALSEIFLDQYNRRHWNLLKLSNEAGVSLIVNEGIIEELVVHFRLAKDLYFNTYRENERYFLKDKKAIYLIDEILIRSYFYAKIEGKVENFDHYMNRFINPDLTNAYENIIDWLKNTFGISYVSDKSISINIDKEEFESISRFLTIKGKHYKAAEIDAKLVLTIYALREHYNETDSAGVFGYRTWWLSKDIITQTAVTEIFGHKYKVNCYLRPDFLNNYLCLTPTRSCVDKTYEELFPSLLGTRLGYHLPAEVHETINKKILLHDSLDPARKTAIIRDLAEQLKVDPSKLTKEFIKEKSRLKR